MIVSKASDVRIGFDAFTPDLDTRQLTTVDREIHLAPKALELLTTLLLERPSVVSKEVLQERLWPGTFVVEANLSNLVGEIRDALGDSARAPRFVQTVHGFGYAFCGDAIDERGGAADFGSCVLSRDFTGASESRGRVSCAGS